MTHLYFSQSPVILDPLLAHDYLRDQDLGIDDKGAALAVAVKGSEVHPLKHGEVKEAQFQKVLNAGYDLLLLLTSPKQRSDIGEEVVITETVLVIGDMERCKAARNALYEGDPRVLTRLETLCKAAL